MEGKIVVMPFTALNESESQGWVGKSIQQSLLADLTPYAPARLQSSDAAAKDSAAAVDAGRKEGARYVVIGNFATVGQDLRVTGQVLDVSTGKSLGAMKATGRTSELFALEDALGNQVRRGLGMTEIATQPAPPDAGVQAAAPPGQAPAQFDYGDFAGGPYPGSNGYGDNWAYGDNGYLGGWGLGGYGGGYGLGFHHHYRQRHGPSNEIWNGSHALGMANSINGVPMGPLNSPSIAASPGPSFYSYGHPVYSDNNISNYSGFSTVSRIRRAAGGTPRGGASRVAPSRAAPAARR